MSFRGSYCFGLLHPTPYSFHMEICTLNSPHSSYNDKEGESHRVTSVFSISFRIKNSSQTCKRLKCLVSSHHLPPLPHGSSHTSIWSKPVVKKRFQYLHKHHFFLDSNYLEGSLFSFCLDLSCHHCFLPSLLSSSLDSIKSYLFCLLLYFLGLFIKQYIHCVHILSL